MLVNGRINYLYIIKFIMKTQKWKGISRED